MFQRFRRWAMKGVWESVFNALVEDPDFEYLMIDATIVRAHQHASGAKGAAKMRPSGVRAAVSTKINVAVDALGNPLRIILTEGQVHDIRQAEALIEGFACEKVLADKGYDFRTSSGKSLPRKAPRPLSRPNVQKGTPPVR